VGAIDVAAATSASGWPDVAAATVIWGNLVNLP
jgi:hypothetical protein